MKVLQIKQLQKSYSSPEGESNLVVNIPDFAMKAGEQVALQGSSGCGKTTFLNLIAGILKADKGQILIEGQNIVTLSEAKRDSLRALKLGYIFQTFNLLQGYTALENVALGMMFGPGVNLDFAQDLLSKVGLEDRFHYYPRQLSIGQQQRVAVARALANQPAIVLADEPTGNLDFRHGQEAIELIQSICAENEAALLLVSHDENILSKFDQRKQMTEVNQLTLSSKEQPHA